MTQPQYETAVELPFKEFSTEPKMLMEQLMKCDDASIAGLTSDLNLDRHLGIDAVRKLAKWDLPGELSAIAYPILQMLARQSTVDFHKNEMPLLQARYLCAVHSDSDNQKWNVEYGSSSWTRYHEEHKMVFRNYDVVFWIHRFGVNNCESIVTIPMYAEGSNSYLVVHLRPYRIGS